MVCGCIIIDGNNLLYYIFSNVQQKLIYLIIIIRVGNRDVLISINGNIQQNKGMK